jgi:superkiller protein 3
VGLLQQAARLRRGAEAALDRAADLQQQARWSEARAVLDQVHDRLGESGPADLRQRVEQARAELRLVRRLDAVRLQTATLVQGKLDYAAADRRYAEAFRRAQLGQPGDDVEAVAARIRRSPARDQLVAALDDWTFVAGDRRRRWLMRVARWADPGRQRDLLRDSAAWADRAALQRRADRAGVERLSPALLAAVGGRLQGLGGDALPLLQAAQALHPGDFWLNFHLGNVLLGARKANQAVGYYRAALALRPRTAAVYNNLGLAVEAQGERKQAIACYRRAIALDPRFAWAHCNLGVALEARGRRDRAIACYEKAIAFEPRFAWAHNNLGLALKDSGQPARAIACLRKAIALDPKLAQAHYNLGLALYDRGQLDQASACYQKALELDPKFARAWTNLGAALAARGQRDRAIACYRKAIGLDPRDAGAHNNLGLALQSQGHLDQAVACYRKALDLNPGDDAAHTNLGNALRAGKDVAGAMACYQKAIALNPKNASAQHNLGGVLHEQGQLARAVACYRKALALNPGLTQAYYNLGNALYAQGRRREAIGCFQKAVALQPRLIQAHYNLGAALEAQGRRDQAVACFQKVLALEPRYAQAHFALGQTLLRQGRFAEARDSTRRSLQILPPRHPLRPGLAALLAQGERFLALDARLPAVLQGKEQPAAGERLEYAQLCRYKQLHAAAARFFADALAEHPKIADDLQGQVRYRAACAAACAAAGLGRDAGTLPERDRARLRRQALDWLKTDLAAWTRVVEQGSDRTRLVVRRLLAHWQNDADLAAVRDPDRLANLSAAEREPWTRLWTAVADLLQSVSSKSSQG